MQVPGKEISFFVRPEQTMRISITFCIVSYFFRLWFFQKQHVLVEASGISKAMFRFDVETQNLP